MSPGALLVLGFGVACVVAWVAWQKGNAARSKGRPMARSVQEGLERAKRKKGARVLIAFLATDDEPSQNVLSVLAEEPELDGRLRGYELVRIDSPKDDLDVAAVVAQKYGVDGLTVPTVLVLDPDGKKRAALAAPKLGGTREQSRDQIVGFLGSVGP